MLSYLEYLHFYDFQSFGFLSVKFLRYRTLAQRYRKFVTPATLRKIRSTLFCPS